MGIYDNLPTPQNVNDGVDVQALIAPAPTNATETQTQMTDSQKMLQMAGYMHMGDGNYIHEAHVQALQDAQKLFPSNPLFPSNSQFAQNHPHVAGALGGGLLGLASYNPGAGPQSAGQSAAQVARGVLAPSQYARQTAIEQGQFVNQRTQAAAAFQKDLAQIGEYNSSARYHDAVAQSLPGKADRDQQRVDAINYGHDIQQQNANTREEHENNLVDHWQQMYQGKNEAQARVLDAQADKAYNDHVTKITAAHNRAINETYFNPLAPGPNGTVGATQKRLQGKDLDDENQRYQQALDQEQSLHQKLLDSRRVRKAGTPPGVTASGQQFDIRKWSAANPGGDKNAARDAARAAGHEIINDDE